MRASSKVSDNAMKKLIELTTIRITKKLKQQIRTYEVHPRETDEQIIKRILDNFANGRRQA